VKGAAFGHIGGHVISDHGPLSLELARHMAAFYLEEAARGPATRHWARTCATRAAALENACREAWAWRRAAGWLDPDAADMIEGTIAR
jgi:hypothetical protein